MAGNLTLPWPQPHSYNTPRGCNMCDTSLQAAGQRSRRSRSEDVASETGTLKLFSLGLRLMMMLNVSYGSSALLWMLLVMSCWYWLGSSHTRKVRLSPRSLGLGSGPVTDGRFSCRGKNSSRTNLAVQIIRITVVKTVHELVGNNHSTCNKL